MPGEWRASGVVIVRQPTLAWRTATLLPSPSGLLLDGGEGAEPTAVAEAVNLRLVERLATQDAATAAAATAAATAASNGGGGATAASATAASAAAAATPNGGMSDGGAAVNGSAADGGGGSKSKRRKRRRSEAAAAAASPFSSSAAASSASAGSGSACIALKALSAASMPDFIAVCVPLILGTLRKPAAQPTRAPPGKVSLGMLWKPPSFSARAP
mmetsp:Transcript_22690/g.75235  ORF Transcript_22690/g.75235 Transcript_22690/m.75235 type:complete len:215 (-) Transcript_22690:81-725(-)